MMVSKCCKESLDIGGDTGHGQTAYYVCSACLRPTDPCASLLFGDNGEYGDVSENDTGSASQLA